MLKVGLLCGVIAAMSATGLKASFEKKNFESKPCDATFIVELEDEIKTISADKAIKQQDLLFSKIKNSINKNAVNREHFTLLNNAFVVSANKEDLEAIKKLPGVKYVTENGTHVVNKTESKSGGFTIDTRALKASEEVIDLNENASAVTMNKPEGTNEGEGTLIAVLDNEFYLRGKHIDDDGNEVEAYHHETFSPLADGVKQKLKYAKVSSLSGTHAVPIANTPAGVEGSLYFNNKVLFYYDYAGDSDNGSNYNTQPDYNVESTLSLHGSHVASIAAGNASEGVEIHSSGYDKEGSPIQIVERTTGYKGIAPKAQLACMKVFSDIKATPVGDKAKMGDYSTFNEVGFISALEDCIKLGVDAINVSIGSDLSDFEKGGIAQRTLQNISDAGILSSISAGNGGKSSYAFTGGYANWTRDMVETGVMGSFANNASTLTVASGQPKWVFYQNALKIGDQTIPYDDQIVNREGSHDYDKERRLQQLVTGSTDPDDVPDETQQEINKEYVYVKGFGQAKDYNNKAVQGKVVVVNRGKSSFAEKLTEAQARGASALLIINNDPTENDFTFRCDFGGENVQIPVAIVLFKDKPFFESNPTGTFKIKRNQSSLNKLDRTISDFSTDGCTYDLDLKPDITTPGSNIKGAVWPQDKFEKQTPFTSYEYLNGTSMAAPNYEGAMSVVLSKIAATDASTKKVNEFKKTIDMRMMSTAIPMHDAEANGENGELSITSPRMQGAGMVNLEGAYNTDVYLEGTDGEETINKSKILLRNNEDIAKGVVKLEFVIHNESSSPKTFTPSFTVMRPATTLSNKVLSSEYHSPVEYDDVRNIPGFQFFSPEREEIIYAEGNASKMDVIKISKDIEYFTSKEEYADGEGTPTGVLKEGLYYCDQENPDWHKGIEWKPVPDTLYQSVKDIEIAKVDNLEPITIAANKTQRIALKTYELTKEQKDKIASLYASGTYIEGYVSLKAATSDYPDLSMPYLGFYSLSDRNSANSFSTAPVVEPFEFEKDPKAIYGSDLINDVAKQLLGKDDAEYGSMMLAGYSKNVEDIPLDNILLNDSSFAKLPGFYPVGTAPTINGAEPELTENPSEDIYVGNPYTSNTLIVQQFVMRSVKDNYFTITNKVTGKEVYRSALEDMLFGATFGKYALYKSHIDADYLGSGYVAHRAYAIVPLYELATKKAFDSGEYELKFNYQLASTEDWVSKSYTLHIDSESPVVSSIIDYKDGNKDMVRITYKDMRASYAVIASAKVDVKFDAERGVYYSEVEKSVIDSAIASSKKTSYSDSRLFIEVFDYARGATTAIVHFDGSDYSHFTIVQGNGLTSNDDFKYENGELKFVRLDEEFNETEFVPDSKLIYVNGVPSASNGGPSLGLILGLSIGGGVLVIGGGVLLYFFLKKKKLGGK